MVIIIEKSKHSADNSMRFYPGEYMTNLKKIILYIIAITTFSAVNANVFFDNELKIGLESAQGMTTKAEYSTQIQFRENILLETDISLTVPNLFADAFFQKIPAFFSLNRIVASYNFGNIKYPTRASFFIGNQDSIGTDTIFQKYFGAKDINSPFFEKRFGNIQPSMLNINGYGIETGTIFLPFLVNSNYLYLNKNENQNHLNLDSRISILNDIFAGDFLVGFRFLIDKFQYNLEDGLTLPLNQGEIKILTSMLLGDNPNVNLYTQIGLTHIQFKPQNGEESINTDNIHIYFEPRFAFNNIKIYPSLFLLSKECTENISFADYSLGGAVFISTTSLIEDGNIEWGSHLSISSNMLNKTEETKLSFIIAPIATIKFSNSSLNIATPIRILEKDIKNIINFSVSYVLNF